MTLSALLLLRPQVAGHLATAIHVHLKWASQQHIPVPPELADLQRMFTDAANGRQGATWVDDLVEIRKNSGVPPRLLSQEQVAESLGLGVRSVQRLMASGELVSVQIGNRTMVRVADLDQYVDELPTRRSVA